MKFIKHKLFLVNMIFGEHDKEKIYKLIKNTFRKDPVMLKFTKKWWNIEIHEMLDGINKLLFIFCSQNVEIHKNVGMVKFIKMLECWN